MATEKGSFYYPPFTPINQELPTVFLAGPVQGAPDWQSEMAQQLQQAGFPMNIASPRRPDMDDPSVRAAFNPHEQIDWELVNIKRAIKFGVVVINFVAQDLSLDYPEGRAYAQTTRLEAGGAILGQVFYGGSANIAIRIDPNYHGGNETYVRHIAGLADIPVVADSGALITNVLTMIHREMDAKRDPMSSARS